MEHVFQEFKTGRSHVGTFIYFREVSLNFKRRLACSRIRIWKSSSSWIPGHKIRVLGCNVLKNLLVKLYTGFTPLYHEADDVVQLLEYFIAVFSIKGSAHNFFGILCSTGRRLKRISFYLS
ncbi:hypothetical protein TNIN_14251 [Trichonephila inaurata madagascariensis]|uniref:Uncharacterized protein n=1 Tax=Trichonephila inaurata madagascariensis TaxID=2747483 RepID=A0A8X6XSK9_9ARAC|nr:hypothetical protein TNIN_14251 [Trichonephila inaurata madagascariensis]